MGQRGGKREGSGRKKGLATIEREKVKDYIAQRIADSAEPLVDVLLEKGLKGDVPAIKELFDRGFGKASQAVDVTSKGEQMGVIDTEAVVVAARLYGESVIKRKLS